MAQRPQIGTFKQDKWSTPIDMTEILKLFNVKKEKKHDVYIHPLKCKLKLIYYTVWYCLIKSIIYNNYNPRTSLLGMPSKEILVNMHHGSCSRIFLSLLFSITTTTTQ